MGNSKFGVLCTKVGHGNYMGPKSIEYVIRYIYRENGKPASDLIAKGGLGVTEFSGTGAIIKQFQLVQKKHTRNGKFGRYIDHEFFSIPHEVEDLIYEYNLDIDAIARKMAYDIYERDQCQVVYGVHRPSGPNEFLHIHFAINTVSYVTGNKRRENKRQLREREVRFQKIVEEEIRGRR